MSDSEEMTHSSARSNSDEPKDKGNLVYYLFILFGIGALLPWNAVLTAIDFFYQSFPGHDPGFVFALTLNGPNFIFNFVNIFIVKYVSLKVRLCISLICIFALTWAMPLIANFMGTSTGWPVILVVIVFLGVANSFAQGGIFGFSGMFPFKYIGAVMFGNGFSGLAMNIFRMITLAIFPPKELAEGEEDNSAFIGCLIYFGIASLILIIVLIGFYIVIGTDFAKYYIKKAEGEQAQRALSINAAARSAGSFGHTDALKEFSHIEEDYEKLDNDDPIPEKEKSFMEVYYEVGFMAIQVFLCFVISFVVFPGTHLSTHFDFLGDTAKDRAWFTVLMITTFNVFDTIGRFAGGFVQIFSPTTVFSLTIFRLIFIPTSVLIQLNSNPAWIFQSDWFRIFNMAAFAISNGYNSTLLMIYGPSFTDNNNKERAGMIMSFHLVGGIFVGSLISSFGMKYVG
ncbi:unnamed protein product [Moneuplotes crassus]|uniref:Uncharacterized protein n=1 Tax=Euplotes crassus TaxID=5936 RepID=A0AAD1U8Y5_EUPCR|nr:unnamed protein product [Moneuplotes crassus]